MLTPKEVSEKSFDKTFGFGYRMDDVDAYLDQVASSMTELLEINADLEKKLEVLADKLNEYRADEESLRTAILGAQKLGDSVIRESKTKAEIITRDATCKAEAMVNNAKRQIEAEQENLARTQLEVANFKNRLLDMYEQHIKLISALPGMIEKNAVADKQPEEPVKEPALDEAAFMPQPEQPAAEEIIDEPAESESAAAPEQPQSIFSMPILDEADDEDEGEASGEEDEDDDTIPFTSDASKFGEMRFGPEHKIKHNGNQPRYRK